jgi:hypothetical protein
LQFNNLGREMDVVAGANFRDFGKERLSDCWQMFGAFME